LNFQVRVVLRIRLSQRRFFRMASINAKKLIAHPGMEAQQTF
jgi:hypothetical protein